MIPLLFKLQNDQQVQELFAWVQDRVGPTTHETTTLLQADNELRLESAGYDPQEPTHYDEASNVDAFVSRAIGTLMELDDHRQSGGHILLWYRDGSVREMSIDPRRDGGAIPRLSALASVGLRRSRGKRSGAR